MTAVNERLGVAVIFRPRCKLWSCETCAQINQAAWTRRAILGTHQLTADGYTVDLVTITAHEKHDVNRAVSKLPDQWNKLRSRWQRTVEKPQYMLTSEVGGRGHFHLHLITTGSISTRWWKDNARAAGFGYMAKESERSLAPERAGMYMTKYLTKGLENDTWAKGFRRVRTSQGWPKIPALESDLDAYFSPIESGTSVVSVLSQLRRGGYCVALADEKASWHVLKTGEVIEGASWLTMPPAGELPASG